MRKRSVYNSKDYSLVLALKEETDTDEQRTRGVGAVTLRDAYGRIVYEGVGEAQCAG
jgi:hypothetical protein